MGKNDNKKKSLKIGQYLVGKDGTKYIKLDTYEKAPEEVRKLVKKLVEVLGTDVLFINMIDETFRKKYKIKDFIKANINVPDPSSKKASKKQDDDDDDNSNDDDDDNKNDDDDSDDDGDF